MEYFKESSGGGTVRLEGELNIQDAGRLKETLVKAFAETEALTLDIGGVTGIDIACMQVLCSAHKTFSRSNKSFTVRGRLVRSFRKSVQDGGYMRTAGCHADPQCSCLWVMGGRDGEDNSDCR